MFRLRFCVTAHRIQHLKYIKISIALDLDFRFFSARSLHSSGRFAWNVPAATATFGKCIAHFGFQFGYPKISKQSLSKWCPGITETRASYLDTFR